MGAVGIYYGLPAGGIGQYNREWLRSMSAANRDHSLEFICLPEFRGRGEIGCDSWAGLYSISSGVPTVRRARFLIGQVVNPRRSLLRMAARGFGVAHLTTFHHLTFPLWRSILDKSGMRLAISAHDVRRAVPILNRQFENTQLAAVYRRADAVFVHSEAQAADLMDFAGLGREGIVVVPHGPYSYGVPQRSREAVRERYGIRPKEILGLCFGQLRAEKNLAGLLAAISCPEISSRILVAGRAGSQHSGASFYEEIARREGVRDRVIFDERFIPDDEVADLVHASDWLAIPYLRSFSSMSGVLNLACHYRRPVLCGSAPALAEAVEKYSIGSVAAVDELSSLREALVRLEEMISAGKQFGFEQFLSANTWEANAKITLETYDRLLAM